MLFLEGEIKQRRVLVGIQPAIDVLLQVGAVFVHLPSRIFGGRSIISQLREKLSNAVWMVMFLQQCPLRRKLAPMGLTCATPGKQTNISIFTHVILTV